MTITSDLERDDTYTKRLNMFCRAKEQICSVGNLRESGCHYKDEGPTTCLNRHFLAAGQC